jgi:predicted small lipoprotein YifL
MRSKLWWPVVVASLVSALAACGGSGGTPPNEPSSPPSSATTSAPTTSSEPLMRLRGVVQEGVEAGCRVLTTDGGQYLLLAGEGLVVPMGTEVIVEGRPAPNLASYCQQGIPFAVSKVEPV